MAINTSGKNRRTIDTNKPDPVAKFWRKRAVCTLLGFSPSTMDRLVRTKTEGFPAPVKLGPNTVAWVAEEVQKWAADRIAARDKAGAQ